MDNQCTDSTLKLKEPHPMARSALIWIAKNFTLQELMMQLEALSSCAIEGNRLGQICAETLSRVIYKKGVSDRYLLGLAWYLKGVKENESNIPENKSSFPI